MTHSVHPSSAPAPEPRLDPRSDPAPGPGCLSAAEIAALSKSREARWRPGLADQPFHSEIFAQATDASGAGLALALARDALAAAAHEDDPLAEAEDRREVLWVQEKRAAQRTGRPCIHGLPPDLRDRLIHVEAATPEDALFALEEGLRCRDLACVIGEITGNPKALDFTASRRLSLAAERHGIALWLVRIDARADLSSARMRWQVEAAPSPAPRWNAAAPGAATWKAELFRARGHAPGEWILSNADGHLSAIRPASRNSPQNNPQNNPRTSFHAGSRINLQTAHGTPFRPPNTRNLVQATVGRSLAAVARA